MSSSRDLLIACVVALLSLALVELGLRCAGVRFEASLYQPDAVLRAVWRPGAEGWTLDEGENVVRINALGMRDRERSVEPPPDTLRIAVLGDSTMAALQVPLERTVTQVVERTLQAAAPKGKHVEVLNFAVGGYAPSQMAMMLQERVWRFQPRVVVVEVSTLTVPNSSRKTASLLDVPFLVLAGDRLVPDAANRPSHPTASQLRWHRILGDLHNRFRLLQLMRAAQQADVRGAIVSGLSRSPPKQAATAPAPAEFMRVWSYRPPTDPDLAEAWKVTEAILHQMAEQARAHDAELWLIQSGGEIEEDGRRERREAFLKVNGLQDFSYARNRYAAFAHREGIHFLALAEPMRQVSETRNVPLRGFFNTTPYTGHWNEQGNAVAGHIIAEALLQNSPGVIAFTDARAPQPLQ